MKIDMKIPSLYVAPSKLSGRGVFSTEPIPAGSIIEICPAIVLTPDQVKPLQKTDLYDYYFQWGHDEKSCAIVLGYGSLYNHSFTPNARYYTEFDSETLEVIALKDIEAGEEITFNYNGEPEDQTAVWFLDDD